MQQNSSLRSQRFNHNQQVQQPQQQYQQPTPDPKAQSWAEQNDWFGEDKIRTAAALAIDADLKEEGFNPTDDDYYDRNRQ